MEVVETYCDGEDEGEEDEDAEGAAAAERGEHLNRGGVWVWG